MIIKAGQVFIFKSESNGYFTENKEYTVIKAEKNASVYDDHCEVHLLSENYLINNFELKELYR